MMGVSALGTSGVFRYNQTLNQDKIGSLALNCSIYLAVRFCEFNFGHKAVIMKIRFTKIDKFILCDKLSFTALTGENLITLVTIIST